MKRKSKHMNIFSFVLYLFFCMFEMIKLSSKNDDASIFRNRIPSLIIKKLRRKNKKKYLFFLKMKISFDSALRWRKITKLLEQSKLITVLDLSRPRNQFQPLKISNLINSFVIVLFLFSIFFLYFFVVVLCSFAFYAYRRRIEFVSKRMEYINI